ncbi:MAG: hypothetical protein KKD25_01820 [Gammaproteobacteria bacterium]|nr:hypothetical protein [Gammaproteobacteria bacterium]MBU0771785.1 hypothetical protein [Gammaproteobacteria bacterium]MBU0855541.1 hypothetical protein [Gammaproteobacteria bacterium]MBU1846103.1 hypothetical protein [Gammaproteobacteria bacterium]
MLIANTGQSLVVMNLRTGEQVQLPPGLRTPLADSKIRYIDDSAVLIALFNSGVLVAYTDAGSAYPGFPTTANPADSKVIPPVDDDYANAVVAASGGRLPNRFGLFGDSRLVVSMPLNTTHRSFVNQANVMMNQAMNIVVNAAVGGQGTAAMLARIDADLLSYKLTDVIMLAGTNDIANGSGASVAIANLTAMYDKILARGIRLFACLEYPANSVYTDATKREALHRINQAIRDYAATHPQVIVVDLFGRLIDATSATGDQIANASYDGIHLSILGAYPCALELKSKVEVIYPTPRKIRTSLTDVVSAAYPNGNIVTNGLFVGTGGSETGPGMSGDTADGWGIQLEAGTATCVGSKVARSDGYQGAIQRLTISASANDTRVRLRQILDLPAQIVAGDFVEVFAEIDINTIVGQVDAAQIYLQWRTVADAVIRTDALPAAGTDAFQPIAGTLYSGLLEVPVTAHDIVIGVRVQLDNGASCVLDVKGFEARKVVR